MSTLLRGALDDVRDLVREEVALARAEVRQEMTKATAAATAFGAAAAAGWYAGLFILTAAALAIAWAFQWPAWTGFAIVGVLVGIIGAVLFMGGRRAVSEMRGLPRTMETVKETFR